jgi:hypothetical protein
LGLFTLKYATGQTWCCENDYFDAAEAYRRWRCIVPVDGFFYPSWPCW